MHNLFGFSAAYAQKPRVGPSATSLLAGLRPRFVDVFFPLARETQHPLRDDVAKDFGRAAPDRERRSEEEPARPPHGIATERPAVEQHPVRAREILRKDESLLPVR